MFWTLGVKISRRIAKRTAAQYVAICLQRPTTGIVAARGQLSILNFCLLENFFSKKCKHLG